MNNNANQAIRALHGLKNLYKFEIMDVKTKTQLFDSIIMPILLYGSEIRGLQNVNNIDKIQMRFYNSILGLNKNTSNISVLCELGKFPLNITCKERLIKVWLKTVTNINCMKFDIYLYQKHETVYRSCKKWASKVKNLSYSLGLQYYWDYQNELNSDSFLYDFCVIKNRKREQYVQSFFVDINSNIRLAKYKLFKNVFEFETYLDILYPKARNILCKFRCSSHCLKIEKGRYLNIERSRRICDLWNLNTLEDEYHFLLACPRFRDLRQKYFKRYYYTWPSIHKFIALMNSKSPSVIKNISKFLIEAFDRRNTILA